VPPTLGGPQLGSAGHRQGADTNEALNAGVVHGVSDVGRTHGVHRGRLPPVGADRREHGVDAVEHAVKGGPIQHVGPHRLQAGAGGVDGSRVADNRGEVVALVRGLRNEGPSRGASAPGDGEVHEGPPTGVGLI
jgi:hypothetical protein